MTQANDSVLVTPGSGVATAAHSPGDGKKYQVFLVADESGHLRQTLPTYSFFIKAQAGAAGKDHWGLFNATGSGKILELRGLWVMPAISAAATGTISPDFDLYRTSAVHTNGTVVGYKSATFPNLSPLDTANANLPAQVTLRTAGTTGGTIAEALFAAYIPQEEVQAGAQLAQWFNLLPDTVLGQRYTARENQGFKLRQITAGAAQNFSFFGVFTLV